MKSDLKKRFLVYQQIEKLIQKVNMDIVKISEVNLSQTTVAVLEKMQNDAIFNMVTNTKNIFNTISNMFDIKLNSFYESLIEKTSTASKQTKHIIQNSTPTPYKIKNVIENNLTICKRYLENTANKIEDLIEHVQSEELSLKRKV